MCKWWHQTNFQPTRVPIISRVLPKVAVPNSVTYLNQTPTLSGMWFGLALRRDIKKTSVQRAWMRAQNMITILGLIFNLIVGTYMIISWRRESSLWSWMSYSHKLQNSWGKWLQIHFGFANHLVLIVCFVSYEKWTGRKKSNHFRPIYFSLWCFLPWRASEE
jgi:hypothetical protein